MEEKDLYWLEFQGESHNKCVDFVANLNWRSDSLSLNSCHGLIYLCQGYPDDTIRGHKLILPNNLTELKILNPMTGEYISLPPCEKGRRLFSSLCGLGFCPKTNQYKVLRGSFPSEEFKTNCFPFPSERLQAEVYTLGSGTWRNIGVVPDFYGHVLRCLDTFINGSLHCLHVDDEDDVQICAFDFEKEQFKSFSLPTSDSDDDEKYYDKIYGHDMADDGVWCY